jgi:hypothetical protein
LEPANNNKKRKENKLFKTNFAAKKQQRLAEKAAISKDFRNFGYFV